MMRRIRNLLADQAGASAVEFALVVMPFLFMIFGTIEVGRAFWIRQVLADVATAGARCMGVMQSQCMDGGASSLSKTRSFIEGELLGRGVAVAREGIVMNGNATCEGLSNFSMVTISTRFSSVFPIDKVINLDGIACFPNQPAEG